MAVVNPTTAGSMTAVETDFYHVSASGTVRNRIASFPFTGRILLAPRAIYVRLRTGRSYGMPTYSYVGVNAKGRRVDGPQGVAFASPTPTGDWFVERTVADVAGTRTFQYLLEQPGKAPKLLQTFQSTSDIHYFTNRHIVINKTPLTESAATGYVQELEGENSAIDSGVDSWKLWARSVNGAYAVGALRLGSRDIMSARLALYAARQSALVKIGNRVCRASQLPGELFSGLSSGCTWFYGNHARLSPKFPLMSAGWNTVRLLIGHNTNAVDLNQKVLTIQTPNNVVFIYDTTGTSSGKGFELRTGRPLTGLALQAFELRYGLQ